MSFLEALAEFGTPAFLLIPARTQVVTTQLYLFFQFPVRTELAAAYAMPLIGVTLGLLLLQRRILGRRKLFPGAQALGVVAMTPFVVPGIVLAIGIYAAYSHPPLLLYGTAVILIIAFTTRFLPIAYSNLNTMVAAINTDLENAARTLGASRIRALRTITVPLLR